MVWTLITRVGGVVGLVGGSFAIYEFFQPINWTLVGILTATGCAWYLLWSGMNRSQQVDSRSRRIETKTDRLLAHFKLDQSDE